MLTYLITAGPSCLSIGPTQTVAAVNDRLSPCHLLARRKETQQSAARR